MSRVHDMGGQTGFGPVPVGEDGEPAFAAARSRKVARDLKQAGLSGRDIAAVLKVSAQRVSQLLKSG